jgi:hypothetical protein
MLFVTLPLISQTVCELQQTPPMQSSKWGSKQEDLNVLGGYWKLKRDYRSQGSIPRVGVVNRKDWSVVVSDRRQGKMASSLGERYE